MPLVYTPTPQEVIYSKLAQHGNVLPYNFWPRNYQAPFFAAMDNGIKRAIMVWHRRAGKDKCAINYMVKEAVKRVGSYYYFFPTYQQGRKIIWDGMDGSGFKFLDHIPVWLRARVNNTEMKITLINGSIIQIIGSDNIDSIVGTNPIGCIFSEFSLQDPSGWNYVIPILKENGGWAIFPYTPRGKNHGWDLYDTNRDNPEWFVSTLTVEDTKLMTPEDVQNEIRQGMDPDLAQQEFYCSFEAALQGAYFATQMNNARNSLRITRVPLVPDIPVDTWWDLGFDDSTSIWFTQDVGREVHFLYYFEASGEGLGFYAKKLSELAIEKKWRYGTHMGPHDIEVHELGPGKTRREQAKEYGIDFKVAPRPQLKEDAIEAARHILPICYFDHEGCQKGLNCLFSYQKTWNEKNKVFMNQPLHNWASHGADAFQTFAMAHRFYLVTQANGGWRPDRSKRII